MIYNFYTFFDKNYLYKGIALYCSLQKTCSDFVLFVLCGDEITYNLLSKMNLSNVKLISLQELEREDTDLLSIKNTRTHAEYLWTTKASLALFLFKKYPQLESVSYLDADLYFFSNPQPLFDELNDDSILITKSDLSPEYKRLLSQAPYNTQFIIFKNHPESIKVLEWWRKKLIERCYGRPNSLLFWRNYKNQNMQGADQIYLKDWLTRFKGIHVLQNNKLCLGPWNANKYYISLKDDVIYMKDTRLVFYHYHSFSIHNETSFTLTDGAYRINESALKLIYHPYIEEIKSIIKEIRHLKPDFNYGFMPMTVQRRLRYTIKKVFYDYLRIKAKLFKI